MWAAAIGFGICGGIILWELSTGIALDEEWRGHRRAENPGKYWRIVGGQAAAVLAVWVLWLLMR